jgi:L-asparaginase II
MAKLTVLTFAKADALRDLGYTDDDFVLRCSTCTNEIESVEERLSESGTADLDTLFCIDGDRLWCGACVVQLKSDEIRKARSELEVCQMRLENVCADVRRLTGKSYI